MVDAYLDVGSNLELRNRTWWAHLWQSKSIQEAQHRPNHWDNLGIEKVKTCLLGYGQLFYGAMSAPWWGNAGLHI